MRRFALLALAASLVCVYAQEPAQVKANLVRKYTAGETQDYVAKFSMKAPAIPDNGEFRAEAVFTRKISSSSKEGGKIDTEFTSAKMFFGDEEMPSEGLPSRKSVEHDTHGLPKTVDLENDDDPTSFLNPAFYLPAKEVALGEKFQFKWASEDGNVKLEGEGTLIATGMLYEEHVAKVSYTMSVTPKGESEGKYEITSYFNLESGKLVKAEGSLSSEDENLGGKYTASFVIGKVRK